MSYKHEMSFVIILACLFLGVSCESGSGSGASPKISAHEFVDALNQVDPQAANSYVVRDTWETERVGSWFVIYDAKEKEYRAVNLSYLRDLGDEGDLTSRDNGDLFVADEFRDDLPGYSTYEDVDYDPIDSVYIGQRTGLTYEDEFQTYDVSLMQGELEDQRFYGKAAAISFQYEVSAKTSIALVKIGEKIERITSQSGELTQEDQNALLADVKELSGVSLEDIQQVALDPVKSKELIEKVANRVGTSASSLQHQILPDLFNINL